MSDLSEASREEITLPVHLTETWFTENMGGLQQKLNKDSLSCIVFHLDSTVWVDPLPFLCLILECCRLRARKPNASIEFSLGEWGTSDNAKLVVRTRKFLAIHGFLECAANNLSNCLSVTYKGASDEAKRTIFGNNSTSVNALIRELRNEDGTNLLFGDSILIPPTVLTPANHLVEIDRLIRVANESYFRGSEERRSLRDSALQRLSTVVAELVKNGLEHAYRDANTGPALVGVYARTRTPQVFTSNTRANLGLPRIEEKLAGEFLIENVSEIERIELTISDVGGGILSDAPLWKRDLPSLQKIDPEAYRALKAANSEEALAKLLFKYPVSRLYKSEVANSVQKRQLPRDGRGHATGLVYLDRVLGYQSDLTCLRTSTSCIFGRHRFNAQRLIPHQLPTVDSSVLRGTHYRISLQLNAPASFPNTWFLPEKNEELCNRIATQISRKNGQRPAAHIDIVDLRLASGSTPMDNSWHAAAEMIVRLPRSIDKNAVRGIVLEWARIAYNSPISKARKTLILTDISRAQARIIHSALVAPGSTKNRIPMATTRQQERALIGSILLFTEDLAVTAIQVVIHEEPLRDLLFISFPTPYGTQTHKSQRTLTADRFVTKVVSILMSLKATDSRVFWNRILEMNTAGDELLVGPVRWRTRHDAEMTLPVYLDLSRALQERDLTRIIRKALRRILALFQHHALFTTDSLVDGEVRDATKWFEKSILVDGSGGSGEPPTTHSTSPILIGSVAITGSTLAKYLIDRGENISYAVDCFVRTETVPVIGEVIHISTLDWIEDTEINYYSSLSMHSDYVFERERQSPFIRRVRKDKWREESVVLYPDGSPVGRPMLPNDMYQTFLNEGLLKLGHWKYGTRHSLIEANTPLAVDHFITTGRGFFPWLVDVVKKYANDPLVKLTVVYPMHRVAAKIIRMFCDTYATSEPESYNFKCLPLQFVPEIADGVAAISDLTLSRLDAWIRASESQTKLCAVFIDIGFINKHTLRQVRRQLVSRNVEVVAAVGVMNRSNNPAFAREDTDRSVQSYWRWNVPTLGRRDQCAVCGALRALAYMEPSVTSHRLDLREALHGVQRAWREASIQDSWWDEGVNPTSLLNSKDVRFGYTTNSSKEGNDNFRRRADDVFGTIWHHVTHTSSTGLLAHYVELSRYTGDGTLLLNKLRGGNSGLSAIGRVECCAGFLLTAGPSLPYWLRAEYARELLVAMFAVEAQLLNNSVVLDWRAHAHIQKIQALAIVATVALDDAVKLSCAAEVVREITHFVCSPETSGERCCIPSPELRLLLLTFYKVCEHEINRIVSADRFLEKMPADKRTEKYVMRVHDVLQTITLSVIARSTLWRNFQVKLGRANTHDGDVIRSIRSSFLAADGLDAATACFALAALLGAHGDDFRESLGMGDNGAAAGTGWIARLNEFGRILRQVQGVELSATLVSAEALVEDIRRRFHRNLLRCAQREHTIAITFRNWLLDNAVIDVDAFLQFPPTLSFCQLDPAWTGTNYLPLCSMARAEIENILKNAVRMSIEPSPQPGGGDPQTLSSAWIDIEASTTGITLLVHNRTDANAATRPGKRTPPFLASIGGNIHSEVLKGDDDGKWWFTVSVFIPWLDAIELKPEVTA